MNLPTCLTTAVAITVFGVLTLGEISAAPPKPPHIRSPSIEAAPTYAKFKDPSTSQYTEYKLKDKELRKQAIAEVQAVTGAESFIARALRVITGNGGSKIFETITGQDGLTFGVKDFTSDAVLPLLELIEKNHPGAVKAAFGPDTKVLEKNWLAARKSTVNDHGLVALVEVRRGLDAVLSDPRFRDEQLERFKAEAVEPTFEVFKNRGYKKEFSLAAMIGAANSGGGGGLAKWLKQAEINVGSKAEEKVIPEFMRIYTMRDANSTQKSACRDLLEKVFEGKSGSLPDWDALGHSGRRLRWLAEYFSWTNGKSFTEFGNFGHK